MRLCYCFRSTWGVSLCRVCSGVKSPSSLWTDIVIVAATALIEVYCACVREVDGGGVVFNNCGCDKTLITTLFI